MASLAQRRRALQAADELLNDLDVDQEEPLDVFDVIDALGLWLVFNRLNSLLGAVVPKGDGGIMLTTQRGPAVQRYTAAHEIGHWILDVNEPAFDTEDDIFYPSVDRERLAQLFAGHLLMPPPLVFATCARHAISSASEATGPAVYLVARDMGASYEATVRQLTHLDIIDTTRRDYLLSLTPARVKAELCHGHRPTGWVDVWPLDISSAGSRVQVTEGDELFVALPENRTTGYRWLTNDEVQGRAGREAASPPGPFVADQQDLASRESLAPRRYPGRTAGQINPALSRVPGNAGSRRILPSLGDAIETAPSAAPEAIELHRSAVGLAEADLLRVEDRFQAGWARVVPSAVRDVRRAIAGRQDVALPDSVVPYLDQTHAAGLAGLNAAVIPVAATGQRLIALRSAGEGTYSLNLTYTSVVDPLALAAGAYHLDVVISPTPQVQHRRQLLDIDLADGALDEGKSDGVEPS